jgi:antitoxin component YwqK of YwqJK toxin-antitoxin module
MDDAAKNLQKSENLFKLNSSPFRHMGKTYYKGGQGVRRSPFKNFK